MKCPTLEKSRLGGTSKVAVRSMVSFLGLIFIVAFFQVTTGGRLLSAKNLQTFSNYAFAAIIPCCGSIFLMSQGNMDYSLAGNICVSAALGALVSQISIPLAIIVMMVSSLVMGAINGVTCVCLGVNSFIATLGTSFMYGGLASVLLGGGSLTANYDLKNLDTLGFKYGAIIAAALVSFTVFNYSVFGKHCRAIGAKAEVAHQSGVRVKLERFAPFLISGFTCAVMAAFSLIRTCNATTTSGGNTQINTMLGLLLGGVPFSGGWNSKFRAVIVGGLIMAVVDNGLFLLNLNTASQQLIKGFIFIIAVALSFDWENTAVIK
jgi:ribose transport system permease protein